MWFTAFFSIFILIFAKINGCSVGHRPCPSANGTLGSCVQSKDCPYIHRLNGAILTPEELDFIKRSICGIDLDNSKLFCCDYEINERLVPSEQKLNLGDFVGILTPVHAEYKDQKAFIAPTTLTTVKPEVVQRCQTPNGEKATCISIYNCPILLSSVKAAALEDEIIFLKESRCGFNADKEPLVCCGAEGKFRSSYIRKSNFTPNPLIPVQCGIQNIFLPNRIFGGTSSDLGEFPWLALISYETVMGNNEFSCGGSLISSRYVLTAAHCVSGDELFTKLLHIRLGEWDFNNPKQDCISTNGTKVCNDPAINIKIESVHVHPGYRPKSRDKYHDIALIRLQKDVNFTRFIMPICLPNINEYISPGERLFLSGWGITNYNNQTSVKQIVNVPVVSKAQCSIMFERSSKLGDIGKGQICAGGEPGKDACVGDSGTPLMKNYNSSTTYAGPWYVEGIVSFGSACGLQNRYGVYTKVSEYVEWIHQTIVS